jgi:hypothetical protein
MSKSRAGAALFACALLASGCHGSLFDLSDGGAGDAAASAGGDVYNPTIQHDLDSLGCATAGPCHAGSAAMHLVPNPVDLKTVQANYDAVKLRATSDTNSLLLLKTLQGSGETHTGSQPFTTTTDPTYERWLSWIRAGNPFAPDGGT